jgi:hypothetical protein
MPNAFGEGCGVAVVGSVRVSDRVGHELGETGDPLLTPRREAVGAVRAGDDRAPEPAAHPDRGRDRGGDARLAEQVRQLPLHPRVVVDPLRAAAPAHLRDRRIAVERNSGAHREHGRALHAPAAEHRLGPVAHEAGQVRAVHAQHRPDLLTDPGEDLRRVGVARHQRRDPAQRRLLLEERLEPRE